MRMLVWLEMGLCRRWLGILLTWRSLIGIRLLVDIEVRYSLSRIDTTHIGLIHRIVSAGCCPPGLIHKRLTCKPLLMTLMMSSPPWLLMCCSTPSPCHPP